MFCGMKRAYHVHEADAFLDGPHASKQSHEEDNHSNSNRQLGRAVVVIFHEHFKVSIDGFDCCADGDQEETNQLQHSNN